MSYNSFLTLSNLRSSFIGPTFGELKAPLSVSFLQNATNLNAFFIFCVIYICVARSHSSAYCGLRVKRELMGEKQGSCPHVRPTDWLVSKEALTFAESKTLVAFMMETLASQYRVCEVP